MRVIITVITFLFLIRIFAYTDDSTNSIKNELLQEGKNNKVVIPDVKLSIEDKSSVELEKPNPVLSNENIQKYGKIDMEELARTKESEKFKSEITEERKKDDFSLSAFKFYYGLYENLLAEVNIGKKTGNLNYLLTYLRNKRANSGFNTNNYYNTELEIDDVNADLIYSITKDIDINAALGYYVRNIGLYTNQFNLSENKENIPVRIGTLYNINMNSFLKADCGYNYLELNHKTLSGYLPKTLWEAYTSSDYEVNWSRDNFLKISGKYSYSSYSNDNLQYGHFNILDKFPFTSSIALQGGAEFDVYSYKNFFWTPNLITFYKPFDYLNMRLGIYGEQNNVSIEKYMNENQIDYQRLENHPPYPEEKWTAIAGVNYLPFQVITLRGNLYYNNYFSYLSYIYNPATELYDFSSISNVGVFEAEGIADYQPWENLTLSASYKYSLPNVTNILFFYYNSAYVNIDFKYPDWMLEISTRLTYKDSCLAGNNQVFPPRWIWDFSIAKSLTKDINAEIKFNNILNQENFERPDVPDGGFTFNAGIRILL